MWTCFSEGELFFLWAYTMYCALLGHKFAYIVLCLMCERKKIKISSQFFLLLRYYQVRATLKTSPKLPAKIEVTLPKASGNGFICALIVW